MKLPKRVLVGYKTYAIRELSAYRSDAENAEGWCRHNSEAIEVRLAGRSGPDVANTLLHEILHACWYMGALEPMMPEEKAVTVLSNQLCQVWRDNPEVASFIAKHSRA